MNGLPGGENLNRPSSAVRTVTASCLSACPFSTESVLIGPERTRNTSVFSVGCPPGRRTTPSIQRARASLKSKKKPSPFGSQAGETDGAYPSASTRKNIRSQKSTFHSYCPSEKVRREVSSQDG